MCSNVSWLRLVLFACVAWVAAATTPVEAVTPRGPDERLLAMSPERPLAVVHWFGLQASEAGTANQTEQLFAEPEVQAFGQAMRQFVRDLTVKVSESPGGPPRAVLERVQFWAAEIVQQPAMLFLDRVRVEDGTPPDLVAGIVLNLGPRATELRGEIENALRSIGAPLETLQLEGQSCVRLNAPDGATQITWTTRDGYLLLTIGGDTMAELLKPKGEEVSKALKAAMQLVPVERRWYLAHVDLGALSRSSFPSLPPEASKFLDSSGLAGVQRLVVSAGLEGSGCVTRSAMACDSLDGLMRIASGEPLSAADFARIPADATHAGVVRFPVASLFEAIEDIVESAGPDATMGLEDGLDQLRQSTGVDLRKDLMEVLGDTWTYHVSGAAMGIVPNGVLTVAVRDRERMLVTEGKITALLQAAMRKPPEAEGPQVAIQQADVGGKPAHYVSGIPVPLAWMVTNDQLVLATSVQTLRSYAMRPAGGDSLANVSAVKQALEGPQRPLTLLYNDSPRTMQSGMLAAPMLANLFAGELAKQGIRLDASALPSWEALRPHMLPSVSIAFVDRSLPGQVVMSTKTNETLPVTSIGGTTVPIMAALLLPAVQSAREAARRAQSMNNLKMLSLSVLNFEAATGRFPAAAIPTKDGKPGLSWRVAMLPYLEEKNLYDQFHLDEPWDSEHNRKLIPLMPEVFRSPSSQAEPGKTTYLAIRGEKAVIMESKTDRGIGVRDIMDGTSRTVWLAEADDARAVEWTKPEDFSPDADDPWRGLGGLRPGGVLAAFVDGHIEFLPRSLPKETLRALFTRDGGEVVDLAP